ncbi:hypothetical protein CAQU_04510 [Corynebacterium aquilae DSM 44791]|uniref:2,3-dihydroxybenzoate-2,3-dehydrogenase n=1 Tax=Corynebacterium aquilae DSM 44791 TaxID=1431546 RepID=A0A1L7CF23_9CORY|nr:hypothetical protein CAQU_04510 [Corynebacterium aquilae DSM 44791]
MNQVARPRIVVTGAAGGIGGAIARHLNDLGADVIATDIHPHPSPIPNHPVHRLDLTDTAAIEEFIYTTLAAGEVHGLVNAAGIFRGGPAPDLSARDLDDLWAVNARAVYLLASGFGAHMATHGGGSIVTIASNSGRIPRANMAAYGATKTAASLLTRSLGLELGRMGVRCNVISPGTSRTTMIAGLGSETDLIQGVPASYKAGIPLGKIAEPADIAHAAAFLLSDAAGHITAQDLVIDGGASAC